MRQRVWVVLLVWAGVAAAAGPDAAAVTDAAVRAVSYAARTLAYQGGYVWWYTDDLSQQAGEGARTPRETIWVQPPGTPTVGMAFLRMYEATGDRRFLGSAAEAGKALAWGQLASGGWTSRIEFGEPSDRALHYRRDWEAGQRKTGKRFNASTFDDRTTQAVLQFLMALDHHLEGSDPAIHHAKEVAIEAVLGAQYANGAWPQVFDGQLETDPPARPVSIPADWRTPPRPNDYWHYYTLNDGVMQEMVDMLLAAWRLTGEQRYLDAATRTGDFLLSAQLPEPHPVWAQQYNFEMEPCWARKFEPPGASSWESAFTLQTLVELWLATGDERFLAPHERALQWFRDSRLPDGRWARFYELGTNRPLYMNRQYELTYDDSDTPPHYGFKQDVAPFVAEVEDALAKGRDAVLAERHPATPAAWRARAEALAPRVAEAIEALDDQGRWVTVQTMFKGEPLPQPRRVIEMEVLSDNLTLFADYLDALQRAEG